MLKLVLGRTGTGKTEYIFNEIKSLSNDNIKDIFLLVPEQTSFEYEKSLLELLGEDAVSNIECSNFKRLYHEVCKVYGFDSGTVLSDGGKIALIQHAVSVCRENLRVYGNDNLSVSFYNSISDFYHETKMCGIDYNDLMQVSESDCKKNLSDKLHDIALILGTYEALLKKDDLDSDEILSKLYNKLSDGEYFKGKTVFIDSFNGFMNIEYKILSKIIAQADSVTVALPCHSLSDNHHGYGVFSAVIKCAQKLIRIAKEEGIEVKAPIILSDKKRFLNKELEALEENLLDEKYTYDLETENIFIYKSFDISEECEYIASKIKEMLFNGECRARDIAVVTRDLSSYGDELSAAFNKYGVPFYDDERQPIGTQPLIAFVKYLFRVINYSFNSDDVLSLAKTGMFDISNEQISNLDNYVFTWKINSSAWTKPFEKSPKGFSPDMSENDKALLAELNRTRSAIIEPVLKFKNTIKNKSVLEICKAIYNLLVFEINADKKLKNIAEILRMSDLNNLALEQNRVWDYLMDLLNQFALTIGNTRISSSEFAELFSLAVDNESLGSLPSGLDNVQFGQADRIRLNNPYAVFVTGLSQDDFPKTNINNSLLSDSERKELAELNFELLDNRAEKDSLEKFITYNSVSGSRNKVFLSYSSNVNDSAKEQSSVITSVLKIFPKIRIKDKKDCLPQNSIFSRDSAFDYLASNYESSNEYVCALKEYFKNDYRLEALKAQYENKDPEIVDKNTALNLFGGDMFISASRIEDYYNCAFRYFCKFGLGARVKTPAEMDSMKTGTLIHYVLEILFSENSIQELSKISESDLYLIIHDLLNRFFIEQIGKSEDFSARFNYQFMRLAKLLFSIVMRLLEEFSQSDFEPVGFEVSIDKDGEVKSPYVNISDGYKIGIRGSVDRVDLCENNGKKYVRVVDYKSGKKEFLLSDVINGLNLQMFVYLFALCKDKENKFSGIPAGVLYMHSSRSDYSVSRSNIEKDIKSSQNKEYCMKGLILNDSENTVAELMEHDLKGNYIPAKMKSTGELGGNIATLEELGALSKKVDYLISQMGFSLHNGIIAQNPADGKNHDLTCDFCDYYSVCSNRKEYSKRSLLQPDNDEVLEMLREENNNAGMD